MQFGETKLNGSLNLHPHTAVDRLDIVVSFTWLCDHDLEMGRRNVWACGVGVATPARLYISDTDRKSP
jgi:hypothetical protein